ncbi:hypothetical protein A2635_05625 [Candidatus Peribacteria bacterium RIFCSPHIGHO2_01_FULL_51_9]|nr:MAG: hypothetical protein A2635_05625 [Candidatus Peribacteria bacterium RIFCSPHIGHO2_01_FULL_51_9]
MNKREIATKEKELIIARLEQVSPKLYFSDGDNASAYSRDEMIDLIRRDEKPGIEFVRTELEFLRAIKNGDLIRALANA